MLPSPPPQSQPSTPTFLYTQHDDLAYADAVQTPQTPRLITAAHFFAPAKVLRPRIENTADHGPTPGPRSFPSPDDDDDDLYGSAGSYGPSTPRPCPSPPPQEGDVLTPSSAEFIPSPEVELNTPPSPPHLQKDEDRGDSNPTAAPMPQAIPRAPSRPSRLFISTETTPSITPLSSSGSVTGYSPLEVKFPWNRRNQARAEAEEEEDGSIFSNSSSSVRDQKDFGTPQSPHLSPHRLHHHPAPFAHEDDLNSPIDTISIPSSSRVPSPSSFHSASSDSHPHHSSQPERPTTPSQFVFRKPEYDALYHQTHFHHQKDRSHKRHSHIPLLHDLKRFFKGPGTTGPTHYNSSLDPSLPESSHHHHRRHHKEGEGDESKEKGARRHMLHGLHGHGHSKSDTHLMSKLGDPTPALRLSREVSLKPSSPLRSGSFPAQLEAPSPARTRSSGPVISPRLRLKTASSSSLSSAYAASAVTYGNTINSYDIHARYGRWGKVLGNGAGGSVRIIRRTSGPDAGQMLAVKQFRPPHEAEPARDYVKKLTAEFCIGSTLHHHNVIQTFDLVKEHESYFEVMEYAPNDLFALVQTGQLSQHEITCLWRQALEGVAYLHASGLAHRDLKLDNLVVTSRGILKIIDFGCAFVFRYPFSTEVDFATGVCGSDPYIAPEQHDQGKPYDPRLSDLWSLAIVYVCMCLRRFPWRVPRASIDPSYRAYVEQAAPHPDPDGGAAPQPTAPSSRRLLKLLPRESRHTMARILEPDPKKRITMEGLAADPWVREMGLCRLVMEGFVEVEEERVLPIPKAHEHRHHLFVGETDFIKVEVREEGGEGKKARRHGG